MEKCLIVKYEACTQNKKSIITAAVGNGQRQVSRKLQINAPPFGPIVSVPFLKACPYQFPVQYPIFAWSVKI